MEDQKPDTSEFWKIIKKEPALSILMFVFGVLGALTITELLNIFGIPLSAPAMLLLAFLVLCFGALSLASFAGVLGFLFFGR